VVPANQFSPSASTTLVYHLLGAYSNGQTLNGAHEKLEQFHQGSKKVFEFKICLEEPFWKLEINQVNWQICE